MFRIRFTCLYCWFLLLVFVGFYVESVVFPRRGSLSMGLEGGLGIALLASTFDVVVRPGPPALNTRKFFKIAVGIRISCTNRIKGTFYKSSLYFFFCMDYSKSSSIVAFMRVLSPVQHSQSSHFTDQANTWGLD